jgi:DNA polymerase III sliding clamp (beta) subunit (PCNA family)
MLRPSLGVCNYADKRKETYMDTITTPVATDTASVTAQLGDIIELFEGAATHADSRKDYLPILNTLRIYSEGGYLYAAATDRYRVISGRIEAQGSSLDLEKSLISLADIKRITSLLKGEGKRMDSLPVTFTRLGDSLSVSVRGNAISIELVSGTYPPIGNYIGKDMQTAAIESVNLNPGFFADYAKIAGKGEAVGITFTGAGKPMQIEVKGKRVEWRALLMPMRRS